MSNGHYQPCAHSKSAYAQSRTECEDCGKDVAKLDTYKSQIHGGSICPSCKRKEA